MVKGSSEKVLNGPTVELSLEAVSCATHPAIARAIEEILNDQGSGSAFSNFVSHSSAAEISQTHPDKA